MKTYAGIQVRLPPLYPRYSPKPGTNATEDKISYQKISQNFSIVHCVAQLVYRLLHITVL